MPMPIPTPTTTPTLTHASHCHCPATATQYHCHYHNQCPSVPLFSTPTRLRRCCANNVAVIAGLVFALRGGAGACGAEDTAGRGAPASGLGVRCGPGDASGNTATGRGNPRGRGMPGGRGVSTTVDEIDDDELSTHDMNADCRSVGTSRSRIRC